MCVCVCVAVVVVVVVVVVLDVGSVWKIHFSLLLLIFSRPRPSAFR